MNHQHLFDQELQKALDAETRRQHEHIELIASENYVSPAIRSMQGSILTNKYAEGYPGKRYYGGCEHVDIIEQLAIDRAKKLFHAEYANVQPHSGSQANQAVYMSVLSPGDTILGMSLAHGGHLTHGSPVNISGKLYHSVSYGLDKHEVIDYEQVQQLAHQHRPKMIVAGASAYSLEIDWSKFRHIADEIGAYLFVDMAHYAGLVAAGEYPSPVPFADFISSTTHKTLRGPRGGLILAKEKYGKMLNASIFPCVQGGPLMHVIGAKAIAFEEAMQDSFKLYTKQIKINAKIMADTLVGRGFRIVSGGTQSHVFLVDLRQKNITGNRAEQLLESAHITTNKNAIPNDPEKPTVTSGIRLGTPAITTRGFKEEESRMIANWIADVIEQPDKLHTIREHVRTLCNKFPLP
jgi:glycine hydroxymethyltransferase